MRETTCEELEQDRLPDEYEYNGKPGDKRKIINWIVCGLDEQLLELVLDVSLPLEDESVGIQDLLERFQLVDDFSGAELIIGFWSENLLIPSLEECLDGGYVEFVASHENAVV